MDPTSLLRRSKKDAAADAAAQAEFNEKRRVWIPDDAEGFLPGWIKSQTGEEGDPQSTAEVVVASSGEVRRIPLYSLSPMNPPQFDGVEDIADLTHLNEASVINNLKTRYVAGSIYTYSGLFLISLNPYRTLPIYTPRIIAQYRTKRREENAPHIFAVAERAWQQIGEERESQSILITGESGAGKTENTKKVIQYLAAIASASASSEAGPSNSLTRSQSISTAPATGLPRSSSFKGKEAEEIGFGTPLASGSSELGLLEQQILQANPILEAFGNAQTMRNNNSSRFGKFIRIFFSPNGAIAGANIDWYLLEKSRVTARAEGERSFHVFYQLLRGAKDANLSERLLLEGGPEKYNFLKKTRLQVDGVDDLTEWRLLKDALGVVGFTADEQFELFRIPALILHIGNLVLTGSASDQAYLPRESQPVAERICHLLGVSVQEFTKTVLSPKVRAGREWVTQARSKKQAEDELGALCKFMYEKSFGWMVDRINTALDRPSAKSLSIGVLDIAGFEIFEENSYEQLLINFTNERLQQFFNFHMFTLEQEEYAREGIEWDYVNFGLDLQPTIELIESSKPIGILSMLDEECIMPKATDLTFTEKVQHGWEKPKNGKALHPGSDKYRPGKFGQGFIIKHYAGDVEYRTHGWLEKNKDPINEPLARLLAQSTIPAISSLFSEYSEDAAAGGVVKRVKRGAFRTVGQRHKEQLGQLMTQLSATQPHFVRCIVPNAQKRPGKVDVNLVLDQLRCNGVLEGIRIARLGYPNRHSFAEFRQRYEVLTPGVIPKGYMDGRKAAGKIAEALQLDTSLYKIGATKIFFKAGVLAELEERRDNLLTDLFRRFQSAARMHIARRRILKLVNRDQSIRTIQRNARVYIRLREWAWWSLYVKVRPLLAATKADSELARKQAELVMAKERAERDEKEKLRLEELKAGLLAEKNKVELDLSSERQLGRDKDTMLQRSKQRESELEEKISHLEKELDLLATDCTEIDAQLEALKEELSNARVDRTRLTEQVKVLEKQEADWRKREIDLMRESKDRSSVQSKLEGDRSALTHQIDQLKREVTQKEEAVKRAKERADLSVAELEKRLQLEKGKSESGNTQVATLTEESRRIRDQLEELQQVVKRHETTIASKQRDIADLESQRSKNAKAQETSDQAKTALQVKIDGLTAEMSTREAERKKESLGRQKLEKELDDLRKVMAAKSSEDSKRQEADRSRESEMARLREQVVTSQKALDDQREAQQQLANRLRVDVEALKSNHTAAQRDLKAALATLREKEQELASKQVEIDRAAEARRKVEAELAAVRDSLKATEVKLRDVTQSKETLDRELQASQKRYDDLEDAVLEIENEKAIWVKQTDQLSRQLNDEAAKRRQFEQELHGAEVELAGHRNTSLLAEREMAKAEGEIKARDAEIALLRSRENKTVVEHVHVLESAKKMTDIQLREQVAENVRLNDVLKQNEKHRNRLISDLEDLTRQFNMLKASKSREARSARASLSPEEKDVNMVLEDERKARKIAEARVASLEKDLQDQRRQLSTASLSSPSRNLTNLEVKLAKRTEEVTKLQSAYDALQVQNQQIESELADLRRSSIRSASSENHNRSDLLRGLQQSHDALGRDMSDQLRKLEAQPLTPSRRHNTSFSNGNTMSPDVHSAKRIRSLENEIAGLRQQVDDEREEKELLWSQLKQVEGNGDSKSPFPYEQAVYSHFRLKAKTLRSHLDHWLAMGDLNAKGSAAMVTSTSGQQIAEDMQALKLLLSKLDPETSPLRVP